MNDADDTLGAIVSSNVQIDAWRGPFGVGSSIVWRLAG